MRIFIVVALTIMSFSGHTFEDDLVQEKLADNIDISGTYIGKECRKDNCKNDPSSGLADGVFNLAFGTNKNHTFIVTRNDSNGEYSIFWPKKNKKFNRIILNENLGFTALPTSGGSDKLEGDFKDLGNGVFLLYSVYNYSSAPIHFHAVISENDRKYKKKIIELEEVANPIIIKKQKKELEEKIIEEKIIVDRQEKKIADQKKQQMDLMKADCKDFGFTYETEGMGNCVLKLMELESKNTPASTTIVNQSGTSSELIDIEKQKLETQREQLKAEQDRLDAERQRVAQERRKEQQRQSQKLMDMSKCYLSGSWVC